MKMYCIVDSFDDQVWGPYTDPALADRVLKIVRMGVDDGAEIQSVEMDEYADELRAGLLPFKIEVILQQGQVLETQVNLTWPPRPEGIVEEREEYIEYFFWATTRNGAIKKIGSVKRNGDHKAACPA